MSKPTTIICIRMDSDLKDRAEEPFKELGMNLATAFTIFIRQSVREGRIPFEVKLEYAIGEPFTAIHGEKNNA